MAPPQRAVRGACLAAVLTVLISVLGPGSSGKEVSSMADVYRGELTPLQRHVAFFDRNKDGVIYPSETYEGTHARFLRSSNPSVWLAGLHLSEGGKHAAVIDER